MLRDKVSSGWEHHEANEHRGKMTNIEKNEGRQSGPVDCDAAVHELYHFLDGELTQERRDQIARHLDQCAPCGSAVHFESELRKVLADQCQDQVPDALKERIALAIGEADRHGA